MGIKLDMLFPMCPQGIALLNYMKLKQFALYYSKFDVFMHYFDEGMERKTQLQYDIYHGNITSQ